jgi:hypothetical protein
MLRAMKEPCPPARALEISARTIARCRGSAPCAAIPPCCEMTDRRPPIGVRSRCCGPLGPHSDPRRRIILSAVSLWHSARPRPSCAWPVFDGKTQFD